MRIVMIAENDPAGVESLLQSALRGTVNLSAERLLKMSRLGIEQHVDGYRQLIWAGLHIGHRNVSGWAWQDHAARRAPATSAQVSKAWARAVR